MTDMRTSTRELGSSARNDPPYSESPTRRDRYAHNARSPLLTIPPELLEFIALHLGSSPPNLGPPAALLPLLSVCRGVHERLGWGRNWGFWARLGRAKFSPCAEASYVPYEGYPYELPYVDNNDDPGHSQQRQGSGSQLIRAAYTLRTRSIALAIIRRGDPLVLGATRALKIAYGMLVEDDWGAEAMDFTQVHLVLGRTPPSDGGARAIHRPQCTFRPSMLRLGIRREAEEEWRPEWAHPAWHAGWPRDAEGPAAALWVLWFFEGEETLRAEPEPLRRHLMGLLLPFVVAPFRYASALAPPHHYSVPLLPTVYAASSAALRAQLGHLNGEGGVTVPTNHGSYPIYALDPPRRPSSNDAAAPLPASGFGANSLSAPSAAVGHAPSRGALQVQAAGHGHPRPHTATRLPHLPRLGYGDGSRSFSRSRLLSAPPARLLFFARMQSGARMGVPTHLPRDRAEAAARWVASGGVGPPPVSPTQEDIHERNARPVVSTALVSSTSSSSTSVSSIPASASASTTRITASIHSLLAVDPELDAIHQGDTPRGRRDGHWAPHRWRASLCHDYAAPLRTLTSGARGESAPRAGVHEARGGTGSGYGGAPPGRIGRVYTLGSFTGLWAGTMLMPSEPPYTALIASQSGAYPAGGLARDDFVAAARPVYMRMREHWSFHPDPPAPPPPADSITADEGLRAGWLPAGTRVVGTGEGTVEVRVPADSAAPSASGWGTEGARGRAEEHVYTYHTVLDPDALASTHPAHDRETCSGCVRVRERERRRRGVALARGEDASSAAREGTPSAYGENGENKSEQEEGMEQEEGVDMGTSDEHVSSTRSPNAPWPEWDDPAWAGHRFDEDEGWEGTCDGVQDVVFTGETDPRHGMAWHHYEYAGRVRPWDGLIGLVMRPRDRTLGLATYFISGHLVGRDTFEGTWQMAAQDVLAPSWGGSVCLARGEE
ncbi:hypothetical protein MVEN_00799400 [Mycena venus]|uniref:F-box domain-containing protein n=1 Tax=Mycena venus TaxID=2733690 RepID=A0A8H6YKE4_9AGAR|nr:hypothetical protein MVEN_00799400 [Mycena venus]